MTKKVIKILITVIFFLIAILIIYFLFSKNTKTRKHENIKTLKQPASAEATGVAKENKDGEEAQMDKAITSNGMKPYFEIAEKELLAEQDLTSEIESDPVSNILFNQAKEDGYIKIGKTVKTTNVRGVSTTIIPLYSEDDKVIYFSRKFGFGASKSRLTKIDIENSSLTTYNDDQSGVETDLVSGEIKSSWGPLTHHSDIADYNVKRARQNHFLWHIGLSDTYSQKIFETMCEVILPSNLFETVITSFLDPADVFGGYVGCMVYLQTIINDADKDVKSGDIVYYLPDLVFERSWPVPDWAINYRPGRLETSVYNMGKGYSGSFQISFFSKILGEEDDKDGEWKYVDSFSVENLRPYGSNSAYPYSEKKYPYLEYTTGEREIIAMKIDPDDLIDEREEYNNQTIVGRDILNQKPEASIDIIYPNPAQTGEYIAFGGSGVDIDGHIALRGYQWDFGNGITWRGEDIIHFAYTTPGIHTVRLKVQDAEGLWSDWISTKVVVNERLNRPEKIDGQLSIVKAFDAPSNYSCSIAWDGEYLWSTDDKELFKVNPKNGQVIEKFDLPFEVNVDRKKTDAVIDLVWDDTNLWATDYKASKLYELDLSGRLINTFDVEAPGPMGLAWDEINLLVSNHDRIIKIDRDGELYSIAELNFPVSGLTWDGKNLWTANVSNIYKLSKTFDILTSYSIPEKEFIYDKYIDYPFKTIDLAWDGRYLWALGARSASENKRAPIIYKVDITGYSAPYVEIPDLGQVGADGFAWDGDGFLATVRYETKKSNKIEKINLGGEHVFTITDEDTLFPSYQNMTKTFEDIAGNADGFWMLSSGVGMGDVIKLDREGKEIFDFSASGYKPRSIAWDGAHVWTSAVSGKDYVNNFIYKYDAKGNLLESFANAPCINNLTWINGVLWCTDDYKRIFKLDKTGDGFEIEEIFTPPYSQETDEAIKYRECLKACADYVSIFERECKNECDDISGYKPALYLNGKGIGWDGQFLWSLERGRLHKMENILINPDEEIQEPYFVKDESIGESEQIMQIDFNSDDWKVYKNEKYKLEFKYHKNWRVNETEYDIEEVTSGELIEVILKSPDGKNTIVGVWKSEVPHTLVAENIFPGLDYSTNLVDIGGRKYQERIYENIFNQVNFDTDTYRLYSILTSDFIYAIRSDFCMNEKEPECDQFISTFVFYE